MRLHATDAGPRWWVVVLLTLPWVQPWAPGPQSNTLPWLLSWVALALVSALGRWPSAHELADFIRRYGQDHIFWPTGTTPCSRIIAARRARPGSTCSL